jgi:hypothetical protein
MEYLGTIALFVVGFVVADILWFAVNGDSILTGTLFRFIMK